MTWVQTRSARAVDLDDPQPYQIDIHDISWSLSRIQRYNGHASKCISVARHSIAVAAIASELVERASDEDKAGISMAKIMLRALMHDAHEAYMGDIVSPLVRCMPTAMAGWIVQTKRALDRVIIKAIESNEEIDLGEATLIEQMIIQGADEAALAIESELFFPDKPRPWRGLASPSVYGSALRERAVQIYQSPMHGSAAGFEFAYETYVSRIKGGL